MSRSADLITSYVPVINAYYTKLHDAMFGEEAAGSHAVRMAQLARHAQITIYCTDKNAAKVAVLKGELAGTVAEEKVVFSRPNLAELLFEQKRSQIVGAMTMNCNEASVRTTAITFCGSPAVAKVVHDGVLRSNLLSDLVGFRNFRANVSRSGYRTVCVAPVIC